MDDTHSGLLGDRLRRGLLETDRLSLLDAFLRRSLLDLKKREKRRLQGERRRVDARLCGVGQLQLGRVGGAAANFDGLLLCWDVSMTANDSGADSC